MTWRWLREDVVVAMHSEQIAEHGGRTGIRDAGLLSSALARPQNQAAYGDYSVFDLAAAYAFGIISNHPFVDGNKRTSTVAMILFLRMNGYTVAWTPEDALEFILEVATGAHNVETITAWLMKNITASEK